MLKVIREESLNIYKELAYQEENEICFSALSDREKKLLFLVDNIPSDNTYFNVLNQWIPVKNNQLADALAYLPEELRIVVLLSYFLDMSDHQIAKTLNMIQRTVSRRRVRSIEGLKKRMGAKEEDEEE